MMPVVHNTMHTPTTTHSWEAVIIVMDTTPFDDLYTIVHEFGDNVWVYAELVWNGGGVVCFVCLGV